MSSSIFSFFNILILSYIVFDNVFCSRNQKISVRVLGKQVLRVNLKSKGENSFNNFKFQAALEKNGSQICGATVITNRILITSAHCIRNSYVENLQIRVGSLKRNRGGQVYKIHSIHNHPLYNKDSTQNDIAIISVKNNLNSSLIKPALLPDRELKYKGEILTVSGWGGHLKHPQDHLQYTHVKVLKKTECKNINKNPDTQICAKSAIKGTGTCYRDSGGPLIRYEKNEDGTKDAILIGVVSGIKGGICTYKDTISYYADVFAFREWIDNTKWYLIMTYSLESIK